MVALSDLGIVISNIPVPSVETLRKIRVLDSGDDICTDFMLYIGHKF
jgi:hypothetical protein